MKIQCVFSNIIVLIYFKAKYNHCGERVLRLASSLVGSLQDMLTKFVRAMKFADKVTLGRWWRRLKDSTIFCCTFITTESGTVTCDLEQKIRNKFRKCLLSIADFTALDAMDFASPALSTESVLHFWYLQLLLISLYL